MDALMPLHGAKLRTLSWLLPGSRHEADSHADARDVEPLQVHFQLPSRLSSLGAGKDSDIWLIVGMPAWAK